MQKILLSLLISIFFYSMQHCQSKTETMNKRFEIEGRQIDTAKQVVYCQEMVGGYDEKTGVNWDGYKYVPCEDIDYKTTNLIFMGSSITFKEYFPIKTTDISSLNIIQHSIGYSYDYTAILSPLENLVYIVWNNCYSSQIDIKGFTHIRQLIFKNKKKELFFIPVGGRNLCKITIPIDEASLQHVFSSEYTGSYYTDKNGLYYFSENGVQQKLESSNGKLVQAILYDRYFVYGDAAYPYASGTLSPKYLRLNTNELRPFNTLRFHILGDNTKLLYLPFNIRDGASIITPNEFLIQGAPQEPISEWKFFDIITIGNNLIKNTLYYPTEKINVGSIGNYYSLIKTSNGFYGITAGSSDLKAIKFDSVMIYNIKINDYEPIEIEHFREFTDYYNIYKDQLYYSYNSKPVETTLDIHKLQPIRLNGKDTEFYTDGTFLVGLGDIDEPLFRDIDWESLQVVNEKTMVDKNNIYQIGWHDLLQVTPIKDLGIDVKIIPFKDKAVSRKRGCSAGQRVNRK